MSTARHHAEWLSLLETSGPFLSMPVLLESFPQGLDAHDADHHRLLRHGHGEWEDNRDQPATHAGWIKFVLAHSLDYTREVLAEGQAVPQTLQAEVPEHGELLRPDFVLHHPGYPSRPRLLVQTYPRTQDLSRPVPGLPWKASPDTRMAHLLHATGVRLGLVTNGERWMLVNAPRGETTGFASWYATLWLEEPITFRAFRTLLGVQRFFGVDDKDTPEQLLARSAANQQEVTDQLGYQVRRAVEVLIQSLDRADQDRGRDLLRGVREAELYEASLTVMMRLVFLFCAEERGLIAGPADRVYWEHYSVAAVREQLQQTAAQYGEEILERRHDAWCRLLVAFRAVHGGVRHDDLKLPAYGGNLFDPDRFPFLEGRKAGTSWRDTEAQPLPVNNRTVLHLLESLQTLETKLPGDKEVVRRRLSFQSLDIEQIGHVYEGLLDHTARRAADPHLGLAGTKDKEPEVPLAELEAKKAKGDRELLAYLKEVTGKSEPALKKLLAVELDARQVSRFRACCHGDDSLWKRVQPFAGLVRADTFDHPVVIPTGSVYVTEGTDRRSSGTHYTPRSLTEPIVQYTLEPLVYAGPAEGLPRAEWKLKPAKELLDLKVCDMACGSGAFLVQACRYMAERLQEAWQQEEQRTTGQPRVAPEGLPSAGRVTERVLADDRARQIEALRLVAQRCIYGVDKNPLAVEMAKLSLWLLTLAKDRPFEFLDHAIRWGDSLVGIRNLKQLECFNLDGEGKTNSIFLDFLRTRIREAIELRRRIESLASNTVQEVEQQERLLGEAEDKLERLKLSADLLVAAELVPGSASDRQSALDDNGIKVAAYFHHEDLMEFRREARKALGAQPTFHWPLEFPEVLVDRGGFDAFVGNPPFMGGRLIGRALSTHYHTYLERLRSNVKGSPDLCTYFFLRAFSLLHINSGFGLLATKSISETGNRAVCLDQLIAANAHITHAATRVRWPGSAAIYVSMVHVYKGNWQGAYSLDGQSVSRIDAGLSELVTTDEPVKLSSMRGQFSQGQDLMGLGFELTKDDRDQILSDDQRCLEVIRPLFKGDDIANLPSLTPYRWAIYFRRMGEAEARQFKPAFDRVERLVKPYRDSLKGQIHEKRFWCFWDYRPRLVEEMESHDWLLASPRVSKYFAFRRVPTGHIYNEKTKLFFFYQWGDFAVLQSSLHQEWVYVRCGTLGATTINYSTSAALETWSMPEAVKIQSCCDNQGEAYHAHRDALMLARHEGLTGSYNRFHDPEQRGGGFKDIDALRELHIEMDRAVAAAYGWSDLHLGHDFHETKHGTRFTISEAARREVLARLLKLNHERYAEEIEQGLHDKKKPTAAKKPRKATAKSNAEETASLPFGEDA